MVNRKGLWLQLFWLGMLGLGPKVLADDTSAQTVTEMSEMQNDIVRLEVALKRIKLQQELDQFNQRTVTSSDVCRPGKGLGTLRLKAIYGLSQGYSASFSYDNNNQLEAQLGDMLLCGEKVVNIALGKVELEKNGLRYQISGSLSAPLAPTPKANLLASKGIE